MVDRKGSGIPIVRFREPKIRGQVFANVTQRTRSSGYEFDIPFGIGVTGPNRQQDTSSTCWLVLIVSGPPVSNLLASFARSRQNASLNCTPSVALSWPTAAENPEHPHAEFYPSQCLGVPRLVRRSLIICSWRWLIHRAATITRKRKRIERPGADREPLSRVTLW